MCLSINQKQLFWALSSKYVTRRFMDTKFNLPKNWLSRELIKHEILTWQSSVKLPGVLNSVVVRSTKRIFSLRINTWQAAKPPPDSTTCLNDVEPRNSTDAVNTRPRVVSYAWRSLTHCTFSILLSLCPAGYTELPSVSFQHSNFDFSSSNLRSYSMCSVFFVTTCIDTNSPNGKTHFLSVA